MGPTQHQNPYRSPQAPAEAQRRRLQSDVRVRSIAFASTLLLGAGTGLLVTHLVNRLASIPPDDHLFFYVYFGAFGLLFGIVGGYFANLFVVRRVRWYHIAIVFGVFATGLPFMEIVNTQIAARLVAAISAIQMAITLAIGSLLRRYVRQHDLSAERSPSTHRE